MTYYAVINDNPMIKRDPNWLICQDIDRNNHIYKNKSDAVKKRDELRRDFDNPDINVYEIERKTIQ